MTRRLYLATSNPHKLRELRALLADLGTEVEALGTGIEETGSTLEENARLKAETSSTGRQDWVVADDSGLEVAALGGAPGVHSARYAGREASYEDNNRKLLRALEGHPDRRARFVCVLALAHAGRTVFTVRGECPGTIAERPLGTRGFGYDPVFIVEGLGRTFAELPAEEKNRVSHRGRALARFRERFHELIRGESPPVAELPGEGDHPRRMKGDDP